MDRIEHARRFGKAPGVEVSRRALGALGNPQEGMRFVHVAGTNGKGSVCAFLGCILQEAGMRTGLFTSPHLVCFEERIRVDGRMIPREAVVRLGNRLLGTEFGVELTMFDYCLLMAVLYFREQGCDIAVFETGLGGRLDSTNALGIPEVSVITEIGYDHMGILGHTLAEIASEKAGILKKGTFLVMERQEPEAERVILERAKEAGVRAVQTVSESLRGQVRRMDIKLPGIHQGENAAAAVLAASEVLAGGGISGGGAPDDICRRGIERTVWRGRMEVLSSHPFLMADGAHNVHGVRALAESLRTMYPGEKFHFIVGVMADKDYGGMMEAVRPIAYDVTAVTPQGERALGAEELAAQLRKNGFRADHASGLGQAVDHLPEDVKTVAFGSLYFIGELIRLFPGEGVGPAGVPSENGGG